MIWSNLSASETYRMYGRVTKSQLEELLDKEAALENMEGVGTHIDEAMGSYPAEDFLEGHKTRLLDLMNKLRGDNRENLTQIIANLAEITQYVFNESEYGRNELKEALKPIEEGKI